nr:hypothetical protein [Victivallales bacterium]
MNEFVVEGGNTLNGEIIISGNKNAILPMIAASLLTDKELILRNAPDILDVRSMIEIAASLGVESSFIGKVLTLKASKIIRTEISEELSSKLRASILFAGPLLARCGSAKIAAPGGDRI